MSDQSWTRRALPGTANLRDPGGYETTDGHRVRRGRFLRSEALIGLEGNEANAVWSPEHAADFGALGLHTVVDLRTELEVREWPSAWAEATGAEVVWLPIPEGSLGSGYDLMGRLLDGTWARFGPPEMGEYYVVMLERRAEVFGTVARLLADPDHAPLLVHCSAGKDRTGVTTALVLESLGVPRDVVVADYALTGSFRPDRVRHHAAAFAAAGVDVEDARTIFESPPEAMVVALEHLDATYGGAAGYLRERAGVTDAELDALRANLLERA